MKIKIGSVYEVKFKSRNTHTAFGWLSKIPDNGNKYMKHRVIKIKKKLNPQKGLDYDYVGDIYDKIDGAIELKNIKIVSKQLILKSSPFKIAGKRKKSKKKTKKKKTKRGTYKKKTHKKRTHRKTYKKMKGGSARRRGGGDRQIWLVNDQREGSKLVKSLVEGKNPEDRIRTLQMLAGTYQPKSLPRMTEPEPPPMPWWSPILSYFGSGETEPEPDPDPDPDPDPEPEPQAQSLEEMSEKDAEAYARAGRNVASVRHEWMDSWMDDPRVTQAQSTQPFPPPEKIETAPMMPPEGHPWHELHALHGDEAVNKILALNETSKERELSDEDLVEIPEGQGSAGGQSHQSFLSPGEIGVGSVPTISQARLQTPISEPKPIQADPESDPEPKPNPILEYRFLINKDYEKFYATLKSCELGDDLESIVVELILEEPIPPERTGGTKFYGVANITITLKCSNQAQFKGNIEDLLGWLLPEFAQFGRNISTPRKEGKTYYEIELTERDQKRKSPEKQNWANISYPSGWLTWTSEEEKDGQLLFDALTAYTGEVVIGRTDKGFGGLIGSIGSELGGDEIWEKAFADLLPEQQREARVWLDKHKDSIKRHMLNFELFGISQLSSDVSPDLLPRVALYLTSCIMGSLVFYMDWTNSPISSKKKENDRHIFRFQKLLMDQLATAYRAPSKPTGSFEIGVVGKKVNLKRTLGIYSEQKEKEENQRWIRNWEAGRPRREEMGRAVANLTPGFFIIKSNNLPCDISYHKPLDSEGGGHALAYLALEEIVMVTEVRRYLIPHPISRLADKGATFELIRLKCDKGWFDGNEYLLYPDGKENVTVLKITKENLSDLLGRYQVKNTVTVRENSDSSSEDNGVLNPGVEVDVTDAYLDEEKISLMFEDGWFDLIRKEPRCFTPEEEKDLKEYLSKIKIEELRDLLEIRDINKLRRILKDRLKLIKKKKKQGKKDSALHTVQNVREARLLIELARGKTESVAIKRS